MDKTVDWTTKQIILQAIDIDCIMNYNISVLVPNCWAIQLWLFEIKSLSAVITHLQFAKSAQPVYSHDLYLLNVYKRDFFAQAKNIHVNYMNSS